MAERNEVENRIRERAQRDAEYRERLLADPRSVVGAEYGIGIPDSLKITIVQESESEVVMVIPPLLPEVTDLSDAELEASSGAGHSAWGTCGNCSEDKNTCTDQC